MAKLEIKLIRSKIGHKPNQKLNLEALGLKRLNSTVIKEDNVQTRGMINKVKHLVSVKEV